MTNEERDALIESARRLPTSASEEALIAALDEARGYAQQLTRRVERGNAIAQRREEELQRERDEARDALTAERAAREDEAAGRSCMVCDRLTAERNEARAQLAALHAAAARFVHSLGDDEEDHPTLGRVRVSRADDGAEENLDRALADLATDAAEHDRRVRADERAKVLREAIAYLEAESADDTRDYCTHLRAMADEIEGTR